MDTRAFSDRGLVHWELFSLASERAILSFLPASPGVYVVVLPEAEPRKKGASDVAYIGSAANQKGLRGRVRQYYHPGPTQSTSRAMRKRLCEPTCRLRLGFIPAMSPAAAKTLEAELLLQFEREHNELPPFNRKRARKALVRAAATKGAG